MKPAVKSQLRPAAKPATNPPAVKPKINHALARALRLCVTALQRGQPPAQVALEVNFAAIIPIFTGSLPLIRRISCSVSANILAGAQVLAQR